MRYICRECGSEIPADVDFCYQCGALKSVAIAVGDDGRVITQPGVCPNCGLKVPADATTCPNCGHEIGAAGTLSTALVVPHRLTKRDYIALALGIIPGALNIFGLGHLIMKRWSRGLMYMAMSTVILYMLYGSSGLSSNTVTIINLVGFGIYLVQSLELFAIVMRPGQGQGDNSKRGP